MMEGTRRIYSGLTWHVTSLPHKNEKKKRLNTTPSPLQDNPVPFTPLPSPLRPPLKETNCNS
jgi:hypothetical protein